MKSFKNHRYSLLGFATKIESDHVGYMHKITLLRLDLFQSELLVSGSKVSEGQQTVKSLEHDLKQRNDQIEILQQTVRRNQDEIRSLNQEVEDVNIALKERKWELQQRATQARHCLSATDITHIVNSIVIN